MSRKGCKECNSFLFCGLSNFLPFPQNGCSDFFPKPKKFVLVHNYLETGHISIIAFSDFKRELEDLMNVQPFVTSLRHSYCILSNSSVSSTIIKDRNLINICRNVADYLAIGEYAMLKKSYFKASSWFEKAKNSAAFAADIIDNY